jgi:hypothetical protein
VNRLLRVVAMAGALPLASWASAQDEAPAARPGDARRDEAFRLVDAYLVSNLQDGLGLSDEQFARVLPLVKKLQTERRAYLLERTRLLRDMRRLMHGGGDEARLLDDLRRLKGLEADGPARVKQHADALDATLSQVQQAKFRLLELEVEQRMRELMNRARSAGPRARRPPQ